VAFGFGEPFVYKIWRYRRMLDPRQFPVSYHNPIEHISLVTVEEFLILPNFNAIRTPCHANAIELETMTGYKR